MISKPGRGQMWGMLLLLAAAALSAQERADITGVWKLNPVLTTSAGQGGASERPFGGRRAPLGGGPTGMGGVGRSPGASGGYSGGGVDPEDAAKAREGVRLAMLTSERLTIVRDGKSYLVTDAQGAPQRWTADGKRSTSEQGALTVETRIKWDGPVLVVERKFEGGVKATDRYSVSGSPRQLLIASKIENKTIPGERDRTLQRVYDLQ
jgi:hypothetical protein